MAKIIFTSSFNFDNEFIPEPASKIIPEWYKKSNSYINGEKKPSGSGTTTATIKKCMPVFDSMISGYLLLTHTDIWISNKEEINEDGTLTRTIWYEWSDLNPIEFHPASQALNYPNSTGNDFAKWMNPWGIKTAKGYSSLFVPPFHRDNKLIALSGIVDTDKYNAPVNIIFTLADPNFEGLIPAGTPIVQVIPFKRDSWSMSIGKEKDIKNLLNHAMKVKARFFDSYKNYFREPKEYK